MDQLSRRCTPDALHARIGRQADHVVEWARLSEVRSSPLARLPGRVLYSVEDHEHVWYLGKSDDLSHRLGCLLAGFTFADERFHPGGARMRELAADPAQLRIAAFLGDDLYRRHYHLVRELKPVCNRETWLHVGPPSRSRHRPPSGSGPITAYPPPT